MRLRAFSYVMFLISNLHPHTYTARVLFSQVTHCTHFPLFQDRRTRRVCRRVHDPSYQRHQESPGVPEQGQEKEDNDIVVYDCRR